MPIDPSRLRHHAAMLRSMDEIGESSTHEAIARDLDAAAEDLDHLVAIRRSQYDLEQRQQQLEQRLVACDEVLRMLRAALQDTEPQPGDFQLWRVEDCGTWCTVLASSAEQAVSLAQLAEYFEIDDAQVELTVTAIDPDQAVTISGDTLDARSYTLPAHVWVTALCGTTDNPGIVCGSEY